MLTIKIDGSNHDATFGSSTSYFAGYYSLTVIRDGETVLEKDFEEKDNATDRSGSAWDDMFDEIIEAITPKSSDSHGLLGYSPDQDIWFQFFDQIRYAVCYNLCIIELDIDEEKLKAALALADDDDSFEDAVAEAVKIRNVSPIVKLRDMLLRLLPAEQAAEAIELLKASVKTVDLGMVGEEKLWDI